ncbi:hypothetical protein [Streptomyces sp. NPDC060065]|uniref:hypothetical protein n=1 Tax=Streptomyces sp. NPDC060065 TaxID=3347050 RepID=UPI00369398A6
MIDPATIDVPEFLERWYGQPDRPSGTLPTTCDWLPAPLKEWHSLASRWSTPLMTVNRMIAPEQVKAGEDSTAVFMEDATGDWRWAFDTTDPDVVHEAELYEPWQRCAESLPELLTHSALYEATYTGSSWRECAQVEEHRLDSVLAPMTQIAFGGWGSPRPGGRIFMSDTLVAATGPAMAPGSPWENRPGYGEVRVATTEPGRLAYLDDMTDIPWTKPLL